ncbi:MAG TPA: hypothetical protein VL860_11395 [Planctomycetota bacterium]|nr:hypothetical protein [Planctomycetota bacterium]
MYKQMAVILVVAGLAIFIYAVTASADFGGDVKGFLESIRSCKSVWIALLGVVMGVIGVMGVLRDRRAKAAAAARKAKKE